MVNLHVLCVTKLAGGRLVVARVEPVLLAKLMQKRFDDSTSLAKRANGQDIEPEMQRGMSKADQVIRAHLKGHI